MGGGNRGKRGGQGAEAIWRCFFSVSFNGFVDGGGKEGEGGGGGGRNDGWKNRDKRGWLIVRMPNRTVLDKKGVMWAHKENGSGSGQRKK